MVETLSVIVREQQERCAQQRWHSCDMRFSDRQSEGETDKAERVSRSKQETNAATIKEQISDFPFFLSLCLSIFLLPH